MNGNELYDMVDKLKDKYEIKEIKLFIAAFCIA